MSNAFAHDEQGRHLRVVQTFDEPARLLDRHGLVLISVDKNRWWIAGSHMRQGGMLLQHPDDFSLAVSDLWTPDLQRVLASRRQERASRQPGTADPEPLAIDSKFVRHGAARTTRRA
jgi:hypothetical protein